MTDFRFRQFAIAQDRCAMKVGTDGVLLGAWAPVTPGCYALDIGTGTGLIALMLAQRGARHVDAVEIDQPAAEQARENINSSPWSTAIDVWVSDFLRFDRGHAYDLIVSNPPFFTETTHSPDKARSMARSADALPIDKLISHAAAMLTAEGTIALIAPASQVDRITMAATIARLNISGITHVRDYQQSAIKRVLIALTKQFTPTTHDELTLRAERGGVLSERFAALTKDFYL